MINSEPTAKGDIEMGMSSCCGNEPEKKNEPHCEMSSSRLLEELLGVDNRTDLSIDMVATKAMHVSKLLNIAKVQLLCDRLISQGRELNRISQILRLDGSLNKKYAKIIRSTLRGAKKNLDSLLGEFNSAGVWDFINWSARLRNEETVGLPEAESLLLEEIDLSPQEKALINRIFTSIISGEVVDLRRTLDGDFEAAIDASSNAALSPALCKGGALLTIGIGLTGFNFAVCVATSGAMLTWPQSVVSMATGISHAVMGADALANALVS